METEEIIRALPKVEQHVHIIGSTRPETLLWVIDDSGAESPFETVEDIRGFFRFRDFPHFIQVYSAVDDLVSKEAYYERLTYEMLEADARCNVRHVECIFSANDHVRRGLDYGLMLDAINRGIRRAEREFGVTCTIRVDLVRNYGPEVGMTVLDWVGEKGDNIVAVDIGGSEDRFPPAPYEEVYRRARGMGLHLVAHAGEAAGPESVRDAVEVLGVERVGHGVAAAKDEALMDLLKERGVTLESCPVSNLRTNVVPSLRQHPIRDFFDRGIRVSVNSDDPTMFGTDMNNEYIQLHRELGFTVPELFKVSLGSLESSFLPEGRRLELREGFIEEYVDLTGCDENF